MAEKPEDLSLPVAVVSRIINDAIPPNTNVAAETRKAIAKAASVFVLYTTANAASIAAKHNRRTTYAADVLEAINEMDFVQFSEPLRKSLEHYQSNLILKKKKSSTPANKKSADDSKSEEASTSKVAKKSTKSPLASPSKNSSAEIVTLSDSDE